MFYLFLKHSHSILRWPILFLLVSSIVLSLYKYLQRKSFSSLDKKVALSALSLVHIQLLLGIVLYFISPKVIISSDSMENSLLRFFLIEHSLLMLIAAGIITLGYSRMKRAKNDNMKHIRLFRFYLSGLILIVISIPWPWRQLAGGWF